MSFKAIKFDSESEAIQWTNASGRGEAVRVDGANYVAEQTECDRLAAAGVEFAYLCECEMPDGLNMIVTVPVN